VTKTSTTSGTFTTGGTCYTISTQKGTSHRAENLAASQ